MNPVRAVRIEEIGHADSVALGEEVVRRALQRRILGERLHLHDEIGLLLEQQRLHVGELRFDDGEVAGIFEPVPLQHDAHEDVLAAADAVDGDDLALQILDRFDRAILQNHVVVGLVALDAVADLVDDDAQIVHPRVLDRRAQHVERHRHEVEFAGGQSLQSDRRAGDALRLERVAFAQMPREAGMLEQDRRELRRRYGIADPKLHRLVGERRTGKRTSRDKQRRPTQSSQPLDHSHPPPLDARNRPRVSPSF